MSSFPHACALFGFGHLSWLLLVASVALACVSWWQLGLGAHVGTHPSPVGLLPL